MKTIKSPKFSIVTPALNCREFLPRNLRSVEMQDLAPQEIEHWILDGGSNDGTVEFLQQQPGIQFVSEPDKGLSDAVNKGIRRSKGEWIIWLNADDELAPNALASFEEAVRKYPEKRLFCGSQKVFSYDGQLEAITPGLSYTFEGLLRRPGDIIQASTFVHRSVYDQVGLLAVDWRYSMDYEWTVRAVLKFPCQGLTDVLTHYHRRRGSIMDANLAAFYRKFLDVRRQHNLSYLSRDEIAIRWYLAMEPLRRIRSIRLAVRRVKALFGYNPTHPIPEKSRG